MKVFSKMLKIVGGFTVFYGIIAGILGSFDYQLEINGAVLPLLDWIDTAICVAVGAVIYLLGHFLTKKFGDIDVIEDVKPTLDMADLGFIVKALKKTRKRNFIMGTFLMLFGIPLLIFPAAMNESSGVIIGCAIFGSLVILIGLISFVQYNKVRNIEMSEIYRLIMYNPQNISGLTVLVVRSAFGKVGQAINATIISENKNKGILSINENDMELLKQYLLKHNPNLDVKTTIQQS